MSDKQKPCTLMCEGVIYPCCEQARGVALKAVPTIWPARDLYGYVLENESDECTCAPRFMHHDWRNGHAQFVMQESR